MQQALRVEHDKNWSEAYQEVHESSIPKGSNVISSYVLYKLKSTEDGTLKVKARICPHGNLDRMKDEVRKG